MRDCRSGGGAQVENLRARRHVNLLDATQNGGSQLGAEGIPHAVLNLLAIGLQRRTDLNPLLFLKNYSRKQEVSKLSEIQSCLDCSGSFKSLFKMVDLFGFCLFWDRRVDR